MKYTFSFLFLVISSVAFAQTPMWEWATCVEGVFSAPFHHIVDSKGNTYIGGNFSGVEFFIAKYNSAGVFEWSQTYGIKSINYFKDLSIDNNDNVIVACTFSDTINIGGIGIKSPSPTNTQRGLLAKLNSNGSAIFAKSISFSDSTLFRHPPILQNVVVSKNGTIFCVGQIPDDLFTRLVFISKFDVEGNIIAHSTPITIAGGNEITPLENMALDSSGNICIIGEFSGNIVFDSLAGIILHDNHPKDIFIAKYDSNGKVLWAKGFGGFWENEGLCVAFDKAGNSYVSGNFMDSMDIDGIILGVHSKGGITPSPIGFIAKFDSQGKTQWAQAIKGYNIFGGVATSGDSTFYVTGGIEDTNYFGATMIYTNRNEIFVAKCNKNGQLIWIKTTSKSTGDFSTGNSLRVIDENQLTVYGRLNGNLRFNGNLVSKQNSPEGVFLAKISVTSGIHSDPSQQKTNITFYPNPTNGLTNFSYTLPFFSRSSISLFNLLGEKVYSLDEGIQSEGAHETTLDLHSLASGTYLVRLKSENEIQTGYIQVIH